MIQYFVRLFFYYNFCVIMIHYFISIADLDHLADPSDVGTISIVELLHRTNLLALVAGGSKQRYAENTGI